MGDDERRVTPYHVSVYYADPEIGALCMYVNVVNHVASRASDDVKLVMYFPAEACTMKNITKYSKVRGAT